MAAHDDPKTLGRARLSFARESDIDEFADMLTKFENGDITADQWRGLASASWPSGSGPVSVLISDRSGLGVLEAGQHFGWSRTSRSGGPRWPSVQMTGAPPVPFSHRRRPGYGSAAATRRWPTVWHPHGGNGNRWSNSWL